MFKKKVKVSLIIIIILAFILFGLITWQSHSIIKQMANIRVEKDSELIHKYQDEIDRIEIENSEGIKISSWRFKEQEPKGIVIILHGMHGQDASSLLDFGHFFNKAKYEAFCMDFRAHGKSEGNEIGFGYTEVKDVIALLSWIKKEPRYENKRVILYGISMGGATAINVATKRQDVSMVISASAFKSYTDTFLDSMRKENVPELVVKMFKY
uniref:Esterase/lipase/thioesterase family protein n=1 Tax=uncultured organism TaxID=155900 RepID=M1Q0W8_9ZZZZ|nr:esterase/lipase/thioesterase family protein [uncultured organism]